MGQEDMKVICCFGADFINKQIQSLENEFGSALTGNDIETIHRMRVASRRLRNGLDLFQECLPGKKMKSWQDDIRKITRTLSNARDLDIQIEFLNKAYGTTLALKYRPGYRRLLLRLKQRRTIVQDKVIKTINKLQNAKTLSRIQKKLAEYTVDEVETHPFNQTLYEFAFKSINQTLMDFLSYKQYIQSRDNEKKLHAMRIAGKHLRYTMEIFSPIYEQALIPYISLMKDIQDQLGSFHDNVVWVNWLPVFIEQEQARIKDYFGNTGPLQRLLPGVNHLIEDRKNAQETAYRSFLETWEILEGENAWDVLLTVIKTPLQSEHITDQTEMSETVAPNTDIEEETCEQEEFEVELTQETLDDTPEGDDDPVPPYESDLW